MPKARRGRRAFKHPYESRTDRATAFLKAARSCAVRECTRLRPVCRDAKLPPLKVPRLAANVVHVPVHGCGSNPDTQHDHDTAHIEWAEAVIKTTFQALRRCIETRSIDAWNEGSRVTLHTRRCYTCSQPTDSFIRESHPVCVVYLVLERRVGGGYRSNDLVSISSMEREFGIPIDALREAYREETDAQLHEHTPVHTDVIRDVILKYT